MNKCAFCGKEFETNESIIAVTVGHHDQEEGFTPDMEHFVFCNTDCFVNLLTN